MASSINEVDASDHLLVIVDDVVGKSDKGGDLVGLAPYYGKVAYVEGNRLQTGIHELGHNMGLIHTFDQKPPLDDPVNFMSYSDQRTSFNSSQLNQVVLNAKNNRLNQGSNFQTFTGQTTNNWFYHTSTNEAPYFKNISTGSKMPKIITHR